MLPAGASLDMESCNDIRYAMDLFFDLTRFVFARAVLFALSNFGMFLLMVLKDFLQELFFFGFMYNESVFVFNLKATHPEGFALLSPGYQRSHK